MVPWQLAGLRGRRKESFGGISIADAMALVREPPSFRETIFGQSVNVTTLALRVFKRWGVKCARCGIEGLYFSVERPEMAVGPCNLVLYGVEDRRQHVRFNVDHQIPLAEGGTGHMDNLRPMCLRCNVEKGDAHEGPRFTLPPVPDGVGVARRLDKVLTSCRECPYAQWSEKKGGVVCVAALQAPWLDGAAIAAQSPTVLHDPSLPPAERWRPIPAWCPLPKIGG